MQLKKITPLSNEYLEKLGFYWHTDADETPYVSDEIVRVSAAEADAYYEAANELYEMFVAAAQHVIDNNLLLLTCQLITGVAVYFLITSLSGSKILRESLELLKRKK